jgi:1,4-dihydroxy-2-naphthoate octaprenyltransferase
MNSVTPTRAWLSAIRPATLPAAAGPIAVGTALAVADGRAHALTAALCLVVALLLQIGVNLHNDAADFARGADAADRLGPPRAVAQGWLAPKAVARAAVIAFGLAAIGGLGLVLRGGVPLLLLGLCSIAAALAYTGGRAPLAYRGLGDVFVLLFFGVVAVCGSYYAQAKTLAIVPLVCSLAVGSLATAILVVNNLRDRDADARANKRTLVVRYGARFGRIEYAALMAFAYAVPVALFVVSESLGWLLPLATLPLAARQLWRVNKSDGALLNAELGATARLGLAFSALLAVGVLL